MDDAYDMLIIGTGWIARAGYKSACTRLGWRLESFDTGDDPAGRDALRHALELARANSRALCVVATPNATHLPLARAFLETGCRVLVEKPACLPAEAAIGAAPLLPVERLFVSTPFRWRPDVARLVEAVGQGAVGEICALAMSWRRRSGIPRPGSWYTSRALAGGGVLTDLGPHLLDLAMTLLDWPTVTVTSARVTAFSSEAGGASAWMAPGVADDLSADVEVAASLALEDDRGRSLRLVANWHDEVTADATVVEVAGTRGRLRLDTLFGFAPGPTVGRLSGVIEAEIPLERLPEVDFARMLERVREGHAATGAQGLNVMKVIASAYSRAGVPSFGKAATDVPR